MVYSKKDLMERMARFFKDKKRGISIKLFADLCGVTERLLWMVFNEKTAPLSETLQRRVSKALQSLERGDIAVMERIDLTRKVEYRKKPKPRYIKSCKLVLGPNGIGLKVGVRNKFDYSNPRLDEVLK